jgi:hypothetical protein
MKRRERSKSGIENLVDIVKIHENHIGQISREKEIRD